MNQSQYLLATLAFSLSLMLAGCFDDEDSKPFSPRSAPPLLVIDDPAYGLEAFAVDPATGLVNLLIDANQTTPSSSPSKGVVLGDRVLFAANDGIHGEELWITDGVATRQLAELCPGYCGEILQTLGNGTQVFIVARGPGDGHALWVSDGTASGTHLLRAEEDEPDGYVLHLLGDAGNGMLIARRDTNNYTISLLRSDGTMTGTAIFRTFGDESEPRYDVSGGAVFNNTLYFAIDNQLWISDGTYASTLQLPGVVNRDPDDQPITPVVMNEKLYVAGSRSGAENASIVFVPAATQIQSNGTTLCFRSDDLTLTVSNGTPAGTRTTLPIPYSGLRDKFLATDSGCLFRSLDPFRDETTLLLARPEQSDNIAVHVFPTPLLRDSLNLLGAAGDRVLFSINASTNIFPRLPDQVWYVQGETAAPLMDLRGNGTIAALGDFVLFSGGTDNELWRSDGTVAGTQLLADINNSMTNHAFPQSLLTQTDTSKLGPTRRSAGLAYFFASTGSSKQLFFTDGTAAGTQQTLTTAADTSNGEATAYGDIFLTREIEDLIELRIASNTTNETRTLDSTCWNDAFDTRSTASAASDGIAIIAVVSCGGLTIWRTDGTLAGTSRFLLSTSTEPYRLNLWATPSLFYLSICDDSREICEIHVTDGSASGTRLIGEIPLFSDAQVIAETLYATRPGTAMLSVIQHTPANIITTTNLLPAGAYIERLDQLAGKLLLFTGTDYLVNPAGRQIWISNATTTGTRLLFTHERREIADWAPTENSIFFSAFFPPSGSSTLATVGELWHIGETPEKTVRLSDQVITTGSRDVYMNCFSNIVLSIITPDLFPKLYASNGEAWFLRKDPVTGIDLWFTNGTTAGTRRITNLPGNDCEISGLL